MTTLLEAENSLQTITNPTVRDSYEIMTREAGPVDAYYRIALEGEGFVEQTQPTERLVPDSSIMYFPLGNQRTAGKDFITVVDHVHNIEVTGLPIMNKVKKLSLGYVGLNQLSGHRTTASDHRSGRSLPLREHVNNYALELKLPTAEVGIFRVMDEQEQQTNKMAAYLFFMMHSTVETTFIDLKNRLEGPSSLQL